MKIVDGQIVGEWEPAPLWPAGAAVGAIIGVFGKRGDDDRPTEPDPEPQPHLVELIYA